MGLLSQGTPMTWEETKRASDHVRMQAVRQFVVQYKKSLSCHKEEMLWGDEMEFTLVKFDHKNKRSFLALRSSEVLNNLKANEQKRPRGPQCIWYPEYGAFAIEGIPARPYGGRLDDLPLIEENLRLRRELIQAELGKDEQVFSITYFPRLGCEAFTWPPAKPDPLNSASRSLFIPDELIQPDYHRYMNLTRNIRLRRGEKVVANIPIFQDVRTKRPFIEVLGGAAAAADDVTSAVPDHIYTDATAFGLSTCSLHVTVQATDMWRACTIYDQLANMCPVMLALTASSPICRGYLTARDTHWTRQTQSMDDRTREERGLEPLRESRYRIAKSRYGSIDCFLSPEGQGYNDVDLVLDPDICAQLVSEGVEEPIARHMSHLMIRDVLSVFHETLDQDDQKDTYHFENIQSTNWTFLRLKIPPPNSDIGWRVEFRPIGAQLTDFENAAMAVFVVLMTRAVLQYNLHLIVPISKIDENMTRSEDVDALRKNKFYFRKDACSASVRSGFSGSTEVEAEIVLMSIDEIFHGKDDYPGLLSIIRRYIDSLQMESDTRSKILHYLEFISLRASGQVSTAAQWMRQFVRSHPEYRHDSVVSDRIQYDLMVKAGHIASTAVTNLSQLYCPSAECNNMSNDHAKGSSKPPSSVKKPQ